MRMRRLSLLIMAVAVVRCEMDTCDKPDCKQGLQWKKKDKLTNCAKYDEAWRIAACAASQSSIESISDIVFADYLKIALSKLTSTNTFYGLGLVLSTDSSMVVGTQKHPVFEKSASIPMGVSRMYKDRVLVDLMFDTDKPVLLYAVGLVPSAPKWSESSWLMRGSGAEGRYVMYRAKSITAMKENTGENCKAFYDWEDRQEVEKSSRVAVIMSEDQWCPSIKDSKFEIVLAKLVSDIRVTPSGDEVYYRAEWAKTSRQEYGEVPMEFQQYF